MRGKYFLLLGALMLVDKVHPQSVPAPAMVNGREKIFVWTDKQTYLPGEVIWFKIYAAALPANTPSTLSNAVYVELINNNATVLKSKIMLVRGSCAGAFAIAEDIPAGNCLLRIRSSFMRNIASGSFEEKVIVVGAVSPGDKPVDAVETTGDANLRIQTDKPEYTTREKMTVNISAADPSGLVISAYKIDSEISEDRSIAVQVQNAYASLAGMYAGADPFYGSAEERYKLDNYTRFNTMEEVFREYIRGVGMGISSKRHRLFVYDELTRAPFRENAFVILDGMPANNIERLLEVDPMKINTIDVVTRKYYLGSKVFYGIVDLKSFNGDMAGYEQDDDDLSSGYEGIANQRVFDHPVYDSPGQKASRHPDFRSTLFWDPSVKTDGNGHAQIRFYTSDQKGKFRIAIHGISPSGKISAVTHDFTVD